MGGTVTAVAAVTPVPVKVMVCWVPATPPALSVMVICIGDAAGTVGRKGHVHRAVAAACGDGAHAVVRFRKHGGGDAYRFD